ncbi:3-oxoacid CoA-transferase subunit A [Actinocorallia herbida]|uniref:3-oxoacid CoA-transferase subunit A n=1 Tax=Actinocorallia herbida TaxID=58109 RepID=A0A3N1CZL4_9ACTN|nr:CoA transferase subunit A [Actinocorallia herbida]ROO86715.1 3-oxoacid CoA-transferase subunit A [Actinocorallia herbida]
MSKLRGSASEALTGVLRDGMVIAVGGFGLSGIPSDLIEAVRDSGVRDLTIVSNNMGVDGKGLGLLLENRQVVKAISSYVGENKLFARQYLDGELDVEFCPQGTLAERLRAGGAGIAGFYTRTGVGTEVAEGKPHEVFDGHVHILERGIVADLSLVHARVADAEGNLRYRRTARNFNPPAAAAGRVCVVQAEIVDPGFLDPDDVMTPGIYVDHVVRASDRPKDIEQRTVRPRPAAVGQGI